ncbi:FliM/FliN family flagellar motor switch protein [Erwinia piriflorinigrans]|uniref:Surface presentation of antigens protein spaO n=1 Tax=Erwinia piriflorinigrans CFBP 5888 TaxID=1161919 RepID=V5Z4I4_9GAMM|nr:FliM/FliN family flagellar motor switch protein [Erwinia piriflorinigrans]CCG86231.1 Surface presentation of antigens protein spaO [Erwinia piriflorinigrans CFBP 5888]
MSLRSHLRLKGHGDTNLDFMLSRHPGSEMTSVLPNARYLQVLFTCDHGTEANAFLNIDTWLEEIDAHLPGIPWQQVPLSYLMRWLEGMQLRFLVEGVIWQSQRVILPVGVLPEKLLSLSSEPCPLLCLDWPEGPSTHLQSVIRPSQIPFTLHYVLGQSQLPLSSLIDIAVGDLLRISDFSPCLTVGHQKIFRLSYHEKSEFIVGNQLVINNEIYRQEEEVVLDWTKLPVDIEFVLDKTTVSLAQLQDIRPGFALPIKPGAEKKIQIYLNRKRFACGELVAMEDGSLAVDINQVTPGSVDETGHSDVEQ